MIEFSEKQAEAMDSVASEKYSFILFGGAMGGGKTFFGLSALLIMCQIFKGSRWCVVRENMEKLRTTTIPSFQKLQPSGKLLSSPYEYTHPNGSKILFKSENYANDKELNWMKGLEVNGFLFEEINECQQLSLDIAFGRAGRWECEPRPKPLIIGTCNPSNKWVKPLIYDRWKNGTLPETWLYIPSKITDNPYLTDEYKANLLNMPKYQYEVFVNGNWDIQLKVGGEFYKCFELDKHVFGDVVYDPKLPLHISWDDNVNPYLPCGIYQIQGKELRLIDEVAGVSPMNTIKNVCNEIIRRYKGHLSGMFIYGDATASKEDTKMEKGHNFYTIIQRELSAFKPNMRVMRSNPSVVMRGNFINQILENEYENITIKISDTCQHTINDLILTKEASDGGKNKEMATDPKTKVRYQVVGHFSDILDYIITTAFNNEYLKFQKGNTGSKLITHGKQYKNTY